MDDHPIDLVRWDRETGEFVHYSYDPGIREAWRREDLWRSARTLPGHLDWNRPRVEPL